MDINLTVQPSNKMEQTENNVIRIPEMYRTDLNLFIGKDMFLKCKNGAMKSFKTSFAYKNDLANPWAAYITQNNFDNLELTKCNPITIGCDPEFFLIDTRTCKISSAMQYFSFRGNVGHDGIVGEFRPQYNDNENDVADNIMYLINKARNKLNTVKDGEYMMLYSASSYEQFAAGYHIHFGLPKFLLINNTFNYKLLRHIVSILDYYVGIMAVLPEGIDDVYRRTYTGISYGKPGAFKYDRTTMEYRTPGAYLLRHPILTKGIMAIGYLVMDDIINNLLGNNLLVKGNIDQTIYNLKQVYNLPPRQEIYKVICSESITRAMNYLPDIKYKLSTMPLYKSKEYNLTNFFDTIENNIKFTGNIEINWRNSYHDRQQKQMGFCETPIKTSYYTKASVLLESQS